MTLDHVVIAVSDWEASNAFYRDVLRAEVVGGNPKSEGNKSFFGLDCVVLTAAP